MSNVISADSAASSRPSAGLVVLLAGLAMFGPFSIDTIFPAFQAMEHALGVDRLRMQQSISVYLVAYAAMSLVHGPLSDALGRKRVIGAGLLVFTVASIGCALAADLSTLLAFRAAQGLSAGAGLIVGRAVIRDLLQGDAAQRLMSQVSMLFGIAPAIAPVIGGWILGWQRWPAIFWFLAGFSLLLLLATWAILPETHPPDRRAPLQLRPLLSGYRQVFGHPRFQRLALAAAFNFAALFLYIASAPTFVVDLLGLNERQFGWFFMPMIAGMTLGAFVSGRAAGRVSGARLADVGFICCGVAAACNLAVNALVARLQAPWAVLPQALNAFGIALVLPIVTLAILDMFPRQRGGASSLQAFTSVLTNAVVAGLLSPWLSQRGLHLALGAACFTAMGWLFWRWQQRVDRGR